MLFEAWAEYTSTNGAHITDHKLLWEAGKAFLRGWITLNTTQFKRHSRQQYMQSSEALLSAHEKPNAEPHPQ